MASGIDVFHLVELRFLNKRFLQQYYFTLCTHAASKVMMLSLIDQGNLILIIRLVDGALFLHSIMTNTQTLEVLRLSVIL